MSPWIDTLSDLPPTDSHSATEARRTLAALAKPSGSLGRLEDLAARLAAIAHDPAPPRLERAHVVVFAGDHGVAAAHATSAYPVEVTSLMVETIRAGRACINALASSHDASVELVDVGVGHARGTADFVTQEAMSREQAIAALERGALTARQACARGVDLLCVGELGIGNTTPATALAAALLGLDPGRLVGPGTGLDEEGIARKTKVISRALRRARCAHGALIDSPDRGAEGALTILSELGGLEHAAAAGCLLEAARLKMPALIDGFVLTSAALMARALAPAYEGYALFATASSEPGHALMIAPFGPGARPLLDLGLRLGEGTGAALAIGVARAASCLVHDVATLAEVVASGEADGGADQAPAS